MAIPYRLPAGLPALVAQKFTEARSSGALIYFPTKVELLEIGGVPFQLRFSETLAHKPKQRAHEQTEPNEGTEEVYDPFESPPEQLYVGNVEETGTKLRSHKIILNKFAIVPEHFILATSDPSLTQTTKLSVADLAASYECIRAYAHEGQELFTFFNSGQASGASQRRRHLQLIPVVGMSKGINGMWRVLIDHSDGEMESCTPILTFQTRLAKDISPSELYTSYIHLYIQACGAVASVEGRQLDIDSYESQISYNLGITKTTMALCPRRAEGATIITGGDKTGFIGLNGTVLAGTLLVKNKAEWDALRTEPEHLNSILMTVGYPKNEPKSNTNSAPEKL